MVERAPQAEALAATWIVRVRPYALQLYALRRRIATGAVALLAAWLFVHVMFGANGMVVYRQKRAEYQELHKRIVEVQQENDRYTQQIQGLKSNQTAIEKEAAAGAAGPARAAGPDVPRKCAVDCPEDAVVEKRA